MPAIVLGSPINTAVVQWNNNFIASRIMESPMADRVNVTEAATWSSWVGTAANNFITFDIGIPAVFGGIGIAAHDMATKAVSYRILYSNDNSDWTVLKPFETPATNEDIFILFDNVLARYWRIQTQGTGASIGIIRGGGILRFPHAPLDGYKPLNHAVRYTKLFNDSIKGQFLNNRVMSSGASTEVDMGFLPRTWVVNNIRGFERRYNTGGTFFYAGCPSKYPLDMGYCRASSSDAVLEIDYTEADKMATVSFGVESYVG